MVDASHAFQNIASALSKLGIIFIPIGIGLWWFAHSREFASDNTKRKIMDYCKLAFMLFAAAQLPTILVLIISR